jgi:hypothetical protein
LQKPAGSQGKKPDQLASVPNEFASTSAPLAEKSKKKKKKAAASDAAAPSPPRPDTVSPLQLPCFAS